MCFNNTDIFSMEHTPILSLTSTKIFYFFFFIFLHVIYTHWPLYQVQFSDAMFRREIKGN